MEYEFNIPKGLMDGEMLRVGGLGNAIKNGVDGDLIINIVEQPHEYFIRMGNDIKQVLNLSYKDLVLGNEEVIVKTMEGKIKIKIKGGTKVGSMLRIPNKGFKRENHIGDMLLEVWLDIPENVSEEEKEKINSLSI